VCAVNGGDDGQHVDTPRYKSLSQSGSAHEVRYSVAALPTAPSSRPTSGSRSNVGVGPSSSPSALKSVSYVETPRDTVGQLHDESLVVNTGASSKPSSERASDASSHNRHHNDTSSRASVTSHSSNVQRESSVRTAATHELARSTANSHDRPKTPRLAVSDISSSSSIILSAKAHASNNSVKH